MPVQGESELQNVTDMTGISLKKCLQVGVKCLGEHVILQNQAFLDRFTHLMQAFCVKTSSCQYFSSKLIFLVSFVRLKYQSCRNLRIFAVKFGLKILLRVKELTFRNSGVSLHYQYHLSYHLFISGSQVMYLNTSFEIVVESTLEEHHHEEDPEFTTKENYHWIAQQEQVPPPTPQQRHPVYFGSEDFS